jgi:Transposase domain (DUF772)
MSLGRRGPNEKQEPIWIEAAGLATPVSHPFYERLNRLLDKHGFDAFAESACRDFYAEVGRPGLAPGVYFRALLVGYFEGIDSERGIAWRTSDSLALRSFLGFELNETTPDHSTISRTRRLIDVETHRKVDAGPVRTACRSTCAASRRASGSHAFFSTHAFGTGSGSTCAGRTGNAARSPCAGAPAGDAANGDDDPDPGRRISVQRAERGRDHC